MVSLTGRSSRAGYTLAASAAMVLEIGGVMGKDSIGDRNHEEARNI
jgi:hypothetical protein